MNSKTRRFVLSQGTDWVVGTVSLLLILGAGLALFAQQVLGKEANEASAAALLLALYLASWLFALGIVGLVLLSLWSLVGWRRVQEKRPVKKRYFPTPQVLEHGMDPIAPNRPSLASEDGTEANSLTKVA